MLAVANYSMKGPFQAIIAICILSMLSVVIAPIGILVGAIIALVTLRISVAEGFKALIWGAVSHVALTVMLSGNYWPGMIAVFEYMLPVWLMSIVLRQTNSLAHTLQFAMIIAGLGVIGFHLIVPNPAEWWLALFNQHVAPALEAAEVVYQPDVIAELAKMVTMLLAVFAVMLWFSILTLGRWWQSALYHSGQFQSDFYQLRLPKSTAYAAIALAVIGLVSGEPTGLVYDLSGVVIVGLMFQGIAIAHQTMSIKQLNKAWLAGLYILLFLFPQTMLILATIGLVDTWVDFRNRWEKEEL
ncbi:MAG: DUF2232 domain-containing protein [Gammaproteobacteria bacterium]|nr:DUF2232 domain-containing protein [Gammaproteobacteria bacterium]